MLAFGAGGEHTLCGASPLSPPVEHTLCGARWDECLEARGEHTLCVVLPLSGAPLLEGAAHCALQVSPRMTGAQVLQPWGECRWPY